MRLVAEKAEKISDQTGFRLALNCSDGSNPFRASSEDLRGYDETRRERQTRRRRREGSSSISIYLGSSRFYTIQPATGYIDRVTTTRYMCNYQGEAKVVVMLCEAFPLQILMLNSSKLDLKSGGNVNVSRSAKGFMHSAAYKRLLNFLRVGHICESGQGLRSILGNIVLTGATWSCHRVPHGTS